MADTPHTELYDMSGIDKQTLAAKVVIEYAGKILILHPSEADRNRRWQMPGGLKDTFEEPLELTAIREVKEELGIELDEKLLKPFKIGEWTAVDHGQKVAVLAVFYHVSLHKKLDIKLSDEHDDYAWIGKENYKQYDANREVYEIVEELLSQGAES